MKKLLQRSGLLNHDLSDVEVTVSTPPRVISSTTTSSKWKGEHSEPEPKRKCVANQNKDNCEPSKQVVPVVQPETRRLPDPCPLPNSFSGIARQAIEQGQLTGNMKTRLLREAAMFYFGICSGGSSSEYITMAKTLCKEYPELKDKKPVIEGEYWVSNCQSNIP